MQTIIIIFSLITIIAFCFVGFILFKKLPNTKEKMRLLVPILIALTIGIVFCLLGMRPPTIEFGRFM